MLSGGGDSTPRRVYTEEEQTMLEIAASRAQNIEPDRFGVTDDYYGDQRRRRVRFVQESPIEPLATIPEEEEDENPDDQGHEYPEDDDYVSDVMTDRVVRHYEAQCADDDNSPVPYAERERFRRYLERSGLMEAMNSALTNLVTDPEIPINFLGAYLEKLSFGMIDRYFNKMLVDQKEHLLVKIAEMDEKSAKLSEEMREKGIRVDGGAESDSERDGSETESVFTEIDTEYELLEDSDGDMNSS